MKEPHVWTPAHDPGRPQLGTPDWWRRNVQREPDWWRRVYVEPFNATDAGKTENAIGQNKPFSHGLTNRELKKAHG